MLIDTDNLALGADTLVLLAAIKQQGDMIMELSNVSQSALAQLAAAQEANAVGLKVLTDLVLSKPATVLTDDGKAQIEALTAQVAAVTDQFHTVDAALGDANRQLAEANQREAAVAQAIVDAANGFGTGIQAALALVQPAAPELTPALTPVEPVNPDTGTIEIPATPEASAEPAPTEQVSESGDAEAGQPAEDVAAGPAPVTPVDNAFMAAQPGVQQPFAG